MKKQYTKKQITEAIAYWEKMLNEANVNDEVLPSYAFSLFVPLYSFDGVEWFDCLELTRMDMLSLDNAKKFLQKLKNEQDTIDDELKQNKNLTSYRILKRTYTPKEQVIDIAM